jgi:hypothetical protein
VLAFFAREATVTFKAQIAFSARAENSACA